MARPLLPVLVLASLYSTGLGSDLCYAAAFSVPWKCVTSKYVLDECSSDLKLKDENKTDGRRHGHTGEYDYYYDLTTITENPSDIKVTGLESYPEPQASVKTRVAVRHAFGFGDNNKVQFVFRLTACHMECNGTTANTTFVRVIRLKSTFYRLSSWEVTGQRNAWKIKELHRPIHIPICEVEDKGFYDLRKPEDYIAKEMNTFLANEMRRMCIRLHYEYHAWLDDCVFEKFQNTYNNEGLNMF